MPSQGRQWIPVTPTTRTTPRTNPNYSGDAIRQNATHVVSHLQKLFGNGNVSSMELVRMPYRQTSEDIRYQSGSGDSVPPPRGQAHVLGDIVGRRFALTRVGGLHIPFYLSSGSAGKVNPATGGTTQGMWLSAMGVHSKDGFINKTKGVESHYESPHLAQIAHTLTQHFSDNPHLLDNVPIVSSGPHTKAMNQSMIAPIQPHPWLGDAEAE